MANLFPSPRVWTRIVFAVALCLATSGCSNQAENSHANSVVPQVAAPWIKAEPNPVPSQAGSDKGTTTISWDAGDGSNAEVYLQVAGKPDQLFSGGSRYKKDATWIKKGTKYEFVLFAGSEHKTELARVAVSGE